MLLEVTLTIETNDPDVEHSVEAIRSAIEYLGMAIVRTDDYHEVTD